VGQLALGSGHVQGSGSRSRSVRRLLGSYEEFKAEVEALPDVGNGVVFLVVRQEDRPVGSTGLVRLRMGWVAVFQAGMVERVTVYTDIDEGRAAAERLAEERG
jgi:hypothetical protein